MADEPEALQIIGEIGHIRVEPGDVLIITSPVSISVETCHRIVKAVTAIFPDHQVIFLDNGAKIEVARKTPITPSTPPQHAEAALAELQFAYTNHRGESGHRRVSPIRVWFGSTDWHPTQQWFLRALDLDKDEERDFAFADIREVSNG